MISMNRPKTESRPYEFLLHFHEYSGLISFRIDWLDLLAVRGTLKTLLQHHGLKASVPWHSAFFMDQLSHPYMTTGEYIALALQNFLQLGNQKKFASWQESYDKPRQCIEKQRHYSANKDLYSQVVMYGCESCTVKKAECQKLDAFVLCCLRRLLKVP